MDGIDKEPRARRAQFREAVWRQAAQKTPGCPGPRGVWPGNAALFIDFFFFLRDHGLKVSLVEWMSLLEALARAESGQIIADEFGVSRERVRQWKNTFGQVLTLYQVHAEVQSVLDEA